MREAIILAGGKGERLRPLTDRQPKTMVGVQGRPILAYQLAWLKSFGIERVLISCGYLHNVIEDYVGTGAAWDLRIDYLVEEHPLGRGGALKQALKRIEDVDLPVLALNGDLITDLDLTELLAFHLAHFAPATVVVVPFRSPYGIVDLADDSTVSGFREKPLLPFFINAGIYLFDHRVVEVLPDKGDHELLTFPRMAANNDLKGYKSTSFWRAVDTVKDINELESELKTLRLEMPGFCSPGSALAIAPGG